MGIVADTGALNVGRGRALRTDLRGREEALEISKSVPSIAPRVDPVVAQPARVAPGPDRVGMHAKQAGRLGDGKGRVCGS